jgi:GTP-binding protein Era
MNEINNIDHRSGYVAFIGEPNVGKSTLLNTLLQQKISIVTRKPQTTRHRITGILTGECYQIVFLDTPGIIEPKYLLQEVMMHYASSALDDADVVLMMVDAEKALANRYERNETAVAAISRQKKPTFLLINKMDLIQKDQLLPMIDAMKNFFPFKEIIPVSALKGIGTGDLVKTLLRYLPQHPPYYPPDIVSENPEKFFVAEIIREKIFEQFSEEIPYSTAVDITEFREREERKHFIGAEIIVERESQKGIIIGKGGAALKKVGEKARRDIERFLGHPVFLELHVKVREKWREDASWLNRFGYTPS